MGFPPRIRELLLSAPGYSSAVRGWVKSARKQKRVAFLRLTDGSEGAGLQVVVDRDRVGEEKWKEIVDRVSLGSSVEVQGEFSLPPSGAKQQVVELQANQFEVLGECPNDTYPLQKKNQTFEFLRTIPHLRGRTNTFGAMLRIRNSAAMAFHNFFQSIGLSWIHAPILTSLDCEGAGELFGITLLY